MVEIFNCKVVILPCRIQTATPDICFRVVTVQFDSPVIVCKSLHRVFLEKITGTPVEVGTGILGLLLDIAVKIGDRFVETLGEKVGDATAVIKSDKSGTQFYRLVEVLEAFFILALTALGYATIMISIGKNRIQTHRTVEILLCTADVSQVVFRDTAEEKIPVVCRVQSGQHIEILNGQGVFAVREGLPAAEEKDIFVVLRIQRACRAGCQTD